MVLRSRVHRRTCTTCCVVASHEVSSRLGAVCSRHATCPDTLALEFPQMRRLNRMLGKGERAMRPRWTYHHRLTPLILSTAALLVGCDRGLQQTAPTVASPVGGPQAALIASGGPSTRWVNGDDPNGGAYSAPGTSCNDPGYPTVQDAVDAAVSGDRINVCPGLYTEQVTIPVGTDNIQLRSVRRWEAVIKAPPVMTPVLGRFTIVRVAGAQNVTILAFTITGPGPGGCGTLHYGVRVDNGGSADILGNHITKIRDDPFSGCQNGVAVLVGRQVEGTIGSAKIVGNVIDDYQKNGPTVDNAGSHAEIAHNRILGHGPTALNAQNGIQVSRGATAEIRHNFVSGHVYTPQTSAATGI